MGAWDSYDAGYQGDDKEDTNKSWPVLSESSLGKESTSSKSDTVAEDASDVAAKFKEK